MLTDSTALSDSHSGSTGEGAVLRERFVLEERLEHGRLGRIFRALDRQWSRDDGARRYVEILILPGDIVRNARQLDAFKREFSTVQALSQRNLVQLYDFDRHGDVHFVVMEWIDGESLRNVLDCLAPELLSEEDAVRVARGVGEALAYAHARGIAHGDVRADNVIVTERGEVKLLLASACLARSAPFAVEPRDDVFALAVLAYELLSGAMPPAAGLPRGEKQAEAWRLDSVTPQQWNALRAALTPQEGRMRTVRQFLDAMGWAQAQRPRPDLPPRIDPGSTAAGSSSWMEPPAAAAPPPQIESPPAAQRTRADAPTMPSPPLRATTPPPRMEPKLDWVEPRVDYRAAHDYAAASLHRPSARRAGLVGRVLGRTVVAAAIMAAVVAVMVAALRVGPEGLETMVARLLPSAPPSGGAVDSAATGGGARADARSAAATPAGAGEPQPGAAPAIPLPPEVGSGGDAGPSTAEPDPAGPAGMGRADAPGSERTSAFDDSAPAEPSATGLFAAETGSGAAASASVAASGAAEAPASAPRLSFGRSAVVATEGQSVVPIELRRADAMGEMMVAWWSEDGSATASDDYADFGRVVETFRGGERSRTIFIPITADSLPESTEEFYVNLTELSDNGRQRGDILRATVTITDDDN